MVRLSWRTRSPPTLLNKCCKSTHHFICSYWVLLCKHIISFANEIGHTLSPAIQLVYVLPCFSLCVIHYIALAINFRSVNKLSVVYRLETTGVSDKGKKKLEKICDSINSERDTDNKLDLNYKHHAQVVEKRNSTNYL